MTMQVNSLERVFRLKVNSTPVDLADPDPSRTPEQVMQLYSNQYEQLTTATIDGPKVEKDKLVYEFKTTHGTKG